MEHLSVYVIFDFFHQCHNFLRTVLLSPLVNLFIPRYSMLFVGMVNGIDSLISLSDISLLVYRNASDFCVLILYSVTMLNSLVSSNNFLMISLGFLCTVSCHVQTVRDLLLLQCGFLLFFSSLSAVARTPKTMFKNSHESGQPCLVSGLRGNSLSFLPLRITFPVGLSYMAFTMLRYSSFYAHCLKCSNTVVHGVAKSRTQLSD